MWNVRLGWEKEGRRMRWIDHTESKLDCGTLDWDGRKKGEGEEGLIIQRVN